MPSKEEIEKVLIQNELDEQLAAKIDKVFETINAEQIKYGELSQFNKDICFIFDALLNREPKEKLTATEILIKNQNNYIQNEKERHIKNKIEQLEAERTETIQKNDIEKQLEEIQLRYNECVAKVDIEELKNISSIVLEGIKLEAQRSILQELLKGAKC